MPDLLDKIMSSIPQSELTPKGAKYLPVTRFLLRTFSQVVDLDSKDDFLEFIRNTPEQPTSAVISLDCYYDPGSIAPYSRDPEFFSLRWNAESIRIQFARASTKASQERLKEIEDVLQLTPASPPPKPQEIDDDVSRLKRSVFIAHSFDDQGRSYAFQVTRFLGLLRFQVSTGEGFSPERVSTKVKRRLKSQEIVVVVLSAQQDPAWLIQEATAADVSEKPIIILVEEGVDFKAGLLGDIEYVRFPKGHVAETFAPMLEGLRELGFNLG